MDGPNQRIPEILLSETLFKLPCGDGFFAFCGYEVERVASPLGPNLQIERTLLQAAAFTGFQT